MATDTVREDIITLSGDAEEVVASLLRENGYDTDTAGMRISIETGGCAGLTYRFDLRKTPEAGDIVCELDQVTVFVERSSKRYVENAVLDFENTAHGTGFCIDNPNADQECGCGISFKAAID